MKNLKLIFLAATSALTLSFLITGCAREISKSKTTSVSSDGTVKLKEKTVTQAPNGTVTTTEEKKTTPSNRP